MRSEGRYPILIRIYLILFVLMPVLNQYKVIELTFLQLYTVFGIIIWVGSISKKKIPNSVLIYILYVLIISLFGYMAINSNSVFRVVLRLINFCLLMVNFFVVLPEYIDFEYLFKIYTKIICFSTLLLILQYIIYIGFGKSTMFLLPNTTLNYNGGINSSEFISYTLGRINTGYYYRPCSIFIEPGFFSMYTIPWISMKLFRKTEVSLKEIFIALVVTGAMVMTTSSMGIIGAIIIWWVFIFRTLEIRKRKMFQKLLFIVPILIIVIIFLWTQSGVQTSIAIKLKSVQNTNTSSSFSWRVLRGIECFKQIGLFQKFFGCGYGDLTSYFNRIHLVTKYDSNLELIDYMSGFFYMLCSIGVVGSILLFRCVMYRLKGKRYTINTKMLIVCLGIIMFTAAVFDKEDYFLYLGFIMASAKCDREKNVG